ncbi:MAG: hypothetical protein WC378_18185 [Opitutaceae bacterium]|jgi:hypothetical protein
MPKIEQAGKYELTAKQASWTESNKGTPCLAIYGETDDGKHITAYVYFSDASAKRSIEMLSTVFGVTGDAADWAGQIEGQRFSATVEVEEYDGKTSAKVKWVNKLGYTPPPLRDTRSTFTRINALAMAIGIKPITVTRPAPNPPSAPKPVQQAHDPVDDDVPF